MAAAALLMSAILAGCSSASPASSPSTAPSESTTPSAGARPYCPVDYSGPCLGPIPAGTYTTVQFQPPITYTVPAGWSNFEDLPGKFLLVPPGFGLAGVDAGGSDYIGIYTSVAAANITCEDSEQPGVGHTAAVLAAEFAQRPGLTVTTPAPVSVGGLEGLVLDIRMADGWTQTCFYSGGEPVVPLILGVGDSDGVDHPIGPGLIMRLYLLDRAGGTLAIEVDDLFGGEHLDAYQEVVDQLNFGK